MWMEVQYYPYSRVVAVSQNVLRENSRFLCKSDPQTIATAITISRDHLHLIFKPIVDPASWLTASASLLL